MCKKSEILDTWYVACRIEPKDFKRFKRMFKERRFDDNFFLESECSCYVIDNKRKLVKVVGRKDFVHDSMNDNLCLSKMIIDFDVMYVMKMCRDLGYQIMLEDKYSN